MRQFRKDTVEYFVLKSLVGGIIVVLFSFYNISWSQCEKYSGLFHKTFAERYLPIHIQFEKWGNVSLQEVESEIKNIKKCPQAAQNKELLYQLDLYLTYKQCLDVKTRKRGLFMLDSLKKPILGTNIPGIIIALWGTEAWINYNVLQDYQVSFRDFYKIMPLLNGLSFEEFPAKLDQTRDIADAFYTFQDYDKAIELLKESIKAKEINRYAAEQLGKAYNTLGLCYQQLGDYNLSNYYFEKIKSLRDSDAKELWIPIASGNMAVNYYRLKKYNQAVPLLNIDIEHAVKTEDLGRAASAYIVLANISFLRSNLVQTKNYIDLAKEYINRSGQKYRNSELYVIMSKYATSVNRPKLANSYLDSAIYYVKMNHDNTSLLKVMRAQQTVHYTNELLAKEKFKSSLQKTKLNRNRWITFVTFLLIGMLLLYVRQLRRAYKRRRLIFKNDLIVAKQQFELDLARRDLINYTKILQEKNQLINIYKSKEQVEIKKVDINRLKEHTILTEEEWQSFRSYFDKVYPNFITNTECIFPSLTKTMLIYLTLTKLGMTTTEISEMLGVTPQAVRNTKSRLFKQIHISDDNSLKELLGSI